MQFVADRAPVLAREIAEHQHQHQNGAGQKRPARVKPEQIVYTVPFDSLEKEGFFAKLK